MAELTIKAFFEPETETYSYIVSAGTNSAAAIIDPVLDFDAKSGRTFTKFADQLITYVKQEKLTVEWILETHAHADHLSAAFYLKQQVGGKIGIGEKITQVQKVFKQLFNMLIVRIVCSQHLFEELGL